MWETNPSLPVSAAPDLYVKEAVRFVKAQMFLGRGAGGVEGQVVGEKFG